MVRNGIVEPAICDGEQGYIFKIWAPKDNVAIQEKTK